MAINARDLLNGTHGTLLMDENQVGEVTSFQAKMSISKKDVAINGRMATDTFLESLKYTGSMEIYRISSRFINEHARAVKEGRDIRCTLTSAIENKNSGAQERVQLLGVSFDEVSLANWASQTESKDTIPFTFADYVLLDSIE